MHRVTYLLPLLLLPALPAFAMKVAPPHACPMFAKLCPDGSSVSPSGPNCELPACPGGNGTQPQPMPPDAGGTSPGGPPTEVPGVSGEGGEDGEAGPGSSAPPPLAGKHEPRKSLLPDLQLDAPKDPQTVKFIVEHRTALNGQHVTVHATVVASINAAGCAGDKTRCPETSLRIADSAEPTRNKAYDTLVNLLPADPVFYAQGQIVDIPVVVMSDNGNLFLQKQ